MEIAITISLWILLSCSGYAVGSHILLKCGKEILPSQVSTCVPISVPFCSFCSMLLISLNKSVSFGELLVGISKYFTYVSMLHEILSKAHGQKLQ